MSTASPCSLGSLDAEHAIEEAHRRLAAVRTRIERAAAAAGRDPRHVTLVAVGKRHPPRAIEALYVAGQRDFGENYLQELRDKARELADLPGLRWHTIGPVQRNKARYAARFSDVVHTLNGEALAEELSRRAEAAGRRLRALVQVNLSREPRRAGIAPERLDGLLHVCRNLPGLQVVGLMTLPPATANPEAARPFFAELRRLAESHGLPERSMGMSADLEVAVQEGATLVRVGTALFGPRPR